MSTIPNDDPGRNLIQTSADDPKRIHLFVAGDTYTILLSGQDTGGRYCLIDMHVPPGGGPPAHRHDFEEMFTVLDGEIAATFRGEKVIVRAGQTINIPANSPHQFLNAANKAARLLCLCAPAMQEEFFKEIGDPSPGPTAMPPPMDEATKAAKMARAKQLAAKYRTEFFLPT